MTTNCSQCNKEINKKPSDIKRFKNNFCNKKCSAAFRTTSKTVQCTECGSDVVKTLSALSKSDSGNTFCNKSCAASFNNKGSVRNWTTGLSSYRERAKREYAPKCSRCNYSEYPDILEVHHIDHDRSNNHLSNLEILCPNCHAIEHVHSYGSNSNKPE